MLCICQLDNLSPYCCRPKAFQTYVLQKPHTHFSSTLPTSSHPSLRANSFQALGCLKDRERTFIWGSGEGDLAQTVALKEFCVEPPSGTSVVPLIKSQRISAEHKPLNKEMGTAGRGFLAGEGITMQED